MSFPKRDIEKQEKNAKLQIFFTKNDVIPEMDLNVIL